LLDAVGPASNVRNKLITTTCLKFCKWAYVVLGFFLELELKQLKVNLKKLFEKPRMQQIVQSVLRC